MQHWCMVDAIFLAKLFADFDFIQSLSQQNSELID